MNLDHSDHDSPLDTHPPATEAVDAATSSGTDAAPAAKGAGATHKDGPVRTDAHSSDLIRLNCLAISGIAQGMEESGRTGVRALGLVLLGRIRVIARELGFELATDHPILGGTNAKADVKLMADYGDALPMDPNQMEAAIAAITPEQLAELHRLYPRDRNVCRNSPELERMLERTNGAGVEEIVERFGNEGGGTREEVRA